MFILIDTDQDGLIPFYDLVNEHDDRFVLAISDLDLLTDYKPDGGSHVIDTLSEAKDKFKQSRWNDLVLASLGVRVFSNDFDVDSPIYAGPVPSLDKARRVVVDASNAESRARHYADYGVNYIGRTKLSPRNIFVLDNKKGNPLHDPSKDPVLEALYASLPDDWWGSCGFVSTSNVSRLEVFLEDFQGDVIPLAFTEGAFAKLRHLGLEFVNTGVPENTTAFGLHVRNEANRLSYKLSQPENPQPVPDDGFKYNF